MIINKQLYYPVFLDLIQQNFPNFISLNKVGDNDYLFEFNGTYDAELLNHVIDGYNYEDQQYIYNDKFNLDLDKDFSQWINFNLTGFAEINEFGDKSKIYWKKPNGNIAIEETPVYTRWKEGLGLLANNFLKRDLKIKFFKKNGSFTEITLPTKIYSNKERIDADKKSRNNVIERCRENTGKYIASQNINLGTPEKIEIQLSEALTMFKNLSSELSVYREDREHEPLVLALNNYPTSENLPASTINFIINQVNIQYY
jgi:hypothetical protein